MEVKEISEYYDNFIIDQLESGINDRIYHLYKKLVRFGLSNESNILELGCGIGTLTYLLAKHVKHGKIEAVDLSPASIAFCKTKIKEDNVSFHVHDIADYQTSSATFNFITLFDIIEHVPIINHEQLFQNLARIADDKTKLLINIPNPEYIAFIQQSAPETLQIIDQPVVLQDLLATADKTGFRLVLFETYSIWVKSDYQFLLLEKKRPFEEINIQSQRSFFEKAVKKIQRTYVRLRHRYH